MTTQPIRILCADDEEAPREQLRLALEKLWPDAEIVCCAENGVDAWDGFLEHEPNVCFLDIRMPGLNGLEVAQRIGREAHIVFVTAYDEYALKAFDAGAVDYLLKPLDEGRLSQCIDRIKARIDDAPATGDLQSLLKQMAQQLQPRQAHPYQRMIQAQVGKEVRMIPTDEVIFFEADSRYTRVVYPGGDALIRTPLKELLAHLNPDKFWQIHRSTIVNSDHVAAAVRVDESNMVVTLKGRTERLPVSRQFQGLFRGQ
ncbi:MAG: response regulator transcription factor [Burkholderiaceae bacterium]|nr:MAG: response regulator transcription factor [Burkholderiaceae bacterium]